MYVVGTDSIAIVDGRVVPAGDRHAVSVDGVVACRSRGAGYQFPALDWPGPEAAQACAACVAVGRPALLLFG